MYGLSIPLFFETFEITMFTGPLYFHKRLEPVQIVTIINIIHYVSAVTH